MTDIQLQNLISKMEEQSIPQHWQEMVVASMADSPERYQKMLMWLDEHKDVPYESMDLVKAVIKIKEEFPIYSAEKIA